MEAGEQAATPRPATAYRYTVPERPVAGAAVDIGHVTVTIELFLTGALDVVARPPARGPAADLACALKALRGMARGLMVRGLGSTAPSIGSTTGSAFRQRRHGFRAPNTLTFTGDCEVTFSRRCDHTDVTVSGAVGYSLEVTATGTGRTRPAATAGRAWFARHDEELASIGMVVLVAAPITPTALTPK